MDDNNHEVANTEGGRPKTSVLQFFDGHWQSDPNPGSLACGQGGNLDRAETVMTALALEPQADGTLDGAQSSTIQSNECGLQGGVIAVPVRATRDGDLPPGDVVADPATVNQPAPPPAAPPPPATTSTSATSTTAAASGPALGEICTDYDKIEYDRNSGKEIVCGANTSPATYFEWVDASALPADVHVVGTPCPGEPQGWPKKSTDGYMVICQATRRWDRLRARRGQAHRRAGADLAALQSVTVVSSEKSGNQITPHAGIRMASARLRVEASKSLCTNKISAAANFAESTTPVVVSVIGVPVCELGCCRLQR